MQERHIRRLPVLHCDQTLAGILTVDDLARGSHDLAEAVLEGRHTHPLIAPHTS